MADIYLHTKLANEVIQTLEYTFDSSLVFLGAQGPDPLYYMQLHKDAKEYRYYADRMHDTNTRGLFRSMVEYTKEHLSQETYSFLVGFICHYALDVIIHPYVYHHVGVYKKEDPSTHSYRGLHLKFERAIDAVIIERDTKQKAHKMRLSNRHFTRKQIPKDVEQCMNVVLSEAYQKADGDVMYQKSVKAMYQNVKHIITDRFGIKKKLYQIIDFFTKETDLFFSDLSFYDHIEEYDYLNLEHRTWHHPVTNEPKTESVDDLYDQAMVFATDMITKVHQYIFENANIDLNTVFTNLSFNSGLPCDHQGTMQYFEIYRKKDK